MTEPAANGLARLALDTWTKVNELGPGNCHVLISCSKSKGTHRDEARNLYVSPLYRKSVLVSEGWGTSFSILSAKHGLLSPEDIIEPYDLTLKGKPQQFKSEWATRVNEQVTGTLGNKCLVAFAGDDYLKPLTDVGTIKYFAPMTGLSLGSRLAFLNYCIRLKKRREYIQKAYHLFARISEGASLHPLKNVLESPIPKQGVYFFFDPSEHSTFTTALPRLVRIGTHGVSAGSTATLRTRLRTHFGTREGYGNHRASVFRLHVGRAFIERDHLHDQFPHWGMHTAEVRSVSG